MAYEFIPASGSVRKDVAERVMPQGLFTTIENGVHEKQGEIRKRPGTSSLVQTKVDGGSISQAVDLMNASNALLLSTGTELFSYGQEWPEWRKIAPYVPLRINEGDHISAREDTSGNYQMVAAASEKYVLAITDLDIGGTDYCVYSIVSVLTGEPIVPWTSLGIATSVFTVGRGIVNCSGGWVVYGSEVTGVFPVIGGVLKAFFISSTDPTAAVTSLGTLHTEAVGNGIPLGYARDGYLLYNRSAAAGGGYVIGNIGSGGLTGTVTRHAAGATSATVIGLDGNGYVYVFGSFPALAALSVEIFNGSLTFQGGYNVDVGAYSAKTACPEAAGTCRVFYESTTVIKTATVTSGGSASVGSNTLGTVNCASHAIHNVIPSQSYHAILLAKSTTDTSYSAALGGWYTISRTALYQDTFFVIDKNLDVIGRFARSEASGGAGPQSCVPGIGPTSRGGPGLFPVIVNNNPNSNSSQGGFRLIRILADVPTRRVELDNLLVMTGGFLHGYTAGRLSELGFHLYPQDITFALSGGGNGLPNGTYAVLAVYKWKDATGRVYRSAPGEPTTIVAAGALQSLTVSLPTLRLTRKTQANGFLAEVEIEFYSTAAGGSVYYYIKSADNDVSADSVDIDFDDTDLATDVELYTTNALDNIAPPAPIDLTSDGTRLYVLGSRNDCWFSKLYSQVDPPDFNDALQVVIDNTAGEPTGVEHMNGSVVVMQPRALRRLYGNSVNNAGGGQFPASDELHGMAGPALVGQYLKTSAGIFMMAESGLWILSRDFGQQYAGQAAEDIIENHDEWLAPYPSGQELRAMAQSHESARVWFAAEDDYVVVFDVKSGTWTTSKSTGVFANLRGLARYINHIAWVNSSGLVYYEDPSNARDGSTAFALTVETGYLRLGGLVGYYRARRIDALVEVRSACTLTITATYDDGAVQSETVGLLEDDIGKAITVGFKPIRRKAQAVKVSLADSNQSSDYTGYRLLGFGIRYDKKAKRPLGATRRF